ncbi:MAG: hypothetical protein H6662_16840 [Ardenticatenaceae bacterium]|nr:hypothetical protein [Anaerolineales bacterium]MCB8923257.1 hypothetical protein [Ardenticatenaceae bacterium]
MTKLEPELITIIEGPTPEFHVSPQDWLQSIYEGPDDRDAVFCQLRTNNGVDIMERCQGAWRQGRTVQLEYPDDLRMRQFADVIAMRLNEVEEGQLLQLWLSLPAEYFDDEEDEAFDEDDDGFYLG